MQNSLWKTMAIVGVIGIGGLAIVKVQQSLGIQNAQSSPTDELPSDTTGAPAPFSAETAARALLTQSAFDQGLQENNTVNFELPDEPPLDSGEAAEKAMFAGTSAVNPQANTPPGNSDVSAAGTNPFDDVSATTVAANYQIEHSQTEHKNVSPVGFSEETHEPSVTAEAPGEGLFSAEPTDATFSALEDDQFKPFHGEEPSETATAENNQKPFFDSASTDSTAEKSVQFYGANGNAASTTPLTTGQTEMSNDAPVFDAVDDSATFTEPTKEQSFSPFPISETEPKLERSGQTIDIPEDGDLSDNPFLEDTDTVPVPREVTPTPSFDTPSGASTPGNTLPLRRPLPPRRQLTLPIAEDRPPMTVPVLGSDGSLSTPDSTHSPSDAKPFPALPDFDLSDDESQPRQRNRFDNGRSRFDEDRRNEKDRSVVPIPELKPKPSALDRSRRELDKEDRRLRYKEGIRNSDDTIRSLQERNSIEPISPNERVREFTAEPHRDELRHRNRNLNSSDFDSREVDSDRYHPRRSEVRQVSAIMSPNLVLEKQAPKNATVGTPLDYSIFVRNEGDATAHEVVVEDDIPSGAEIVSAAPVATRNRNTNKLKWQFTSIEPGDQKEIRVRVTPTGEGTLDGLATVKFKSRVRATTVITAPRLRLLMQGPENAKLGQEVQYSYVITNEGTGEAQNVIIRTVLPNNGGLKHPAGQDIEYEISALKPDEQREIVLTVVAADSGEFTTQAEVTARGGVKDQASVRTNVIGSLLTIVRRGPKRRFVHRPGVYENIVSNDTEFAAIDAKVVEQIPEGMRFVSADNGGEFDSRNNSVTWNIDRLGANRSKTLQIELRPTSAGTAESIVTVFENNGDSGDDYISTTQVEDLHNVSADINRLNGPDGPIGPIGPVEVNEEFGFTITVDNRGTADATDVELVVRVPDEITVIGAGSKEVQAQLLEGNLVQYSQIINIEPNTQKDFDLKLKGKRPVTNGLVEASVRYRQMSEPLKLSESVTVYSDEL